MPYFFWLKICLTFSVSMKLSFVTALIAVSFLDWRIITSLITKTLVYILCSFCCSHINFVTHLVRCLWFPRFPLIILVNSGVCKEVLQLAYLSVIDIDPKFLMHFWNDFFSMDADMAFCASVYTFVDTILLNTACP